MDVLEQLTGNRVNYSANILGGVKFDVTDTISDAIRRGLDFLTERTLYYLDIVSQDRIFLQRTRGVGTMTHAQAERLGVTGPTARASGLRRDLRVDAPYAAYNDFAIQVVLETAGDLEARFIVRLKELLETYGLIRSLLDKLPDGELKARMPRRIAAGEVISRVEAPRGELFYFIKSNGTDQPERIKVRTPTLSNMASVIQLALGLQLADMPMLLTGIDPCFSCNDRLTTVRTDGDSATWTWEKLRQYGIAYYQKKVGDA
jgi:NADH-quinone oxidoreductase subunit D